MGVMLNRDCLSMMEEILMNSPFVRKEEFYGKLDFVLFCVECGLGGIVKLLGGWEVDGGMGGDEV